MSKKLVFGVGVNDVEYAVQIKEVVSGRYKNGKQKQRLVWMCPFYSVWVDMLRRSYDKSCKLRRPTYNEAAVCEDWHRLSIFKAWMEQQDWEGKQLDKDLLLKGNKTYAPETCIFVSREVNMFLLDRAASRGEYKIGVSWHKGCGKFVAQCCNPLLLKKEHLGYFTTEESAHEAWAKKKLEHAHTLAELQDDSRIAEALIRRYDFNKEEHEHCKT